MEFFVKRSDNYSPSLRRVVISMFILTAVVVIGVVGYVWIEGYSFVEALYMTIIIIMTVGFGEVRPLDTAGMYFTIFVVIIGVSAMVIFLSAVFEFILSEYFGVWGRRRMEKKISKLSDHYIICGYGRVGRSVAEELDRQGKPFVAIEIDGEAYQDCADQGHLAIHGSATDNDVLLEAGITEARGLISALKSDADNLYVILTARVMRPDLFLVARADQPGAEEKLELVGADRVISPHQIAGKRMASLMVFPGAYEFLDAVVGGNLPEYQLAELEIGSGSRLKGKTIKGSGLRENTGVTVLAVSKSSREGFNPNPSPDITIEEGDMLVLIGTPEQMAAMYEDYG